MNNLLSKLHIRGTGTKLINLLARGDLHVNLFDGACKKHGKADAQNKDNISARNIRNKVLAKIAWLRVKALHFSVTERAAAFAVLYVIRSESSKK